MEIEFDEGDVPMLVDVARDPPSPDPLSNTLDDLSLVKVPITIVTGMSCWCYWKASVLGRIRSPRVTLPRTLRFDCNIRQDISSCIKFRFPLSTDINLQATLVPARQLF
jgi:hypothetical protein